MERLRERTTYGGAKAMDRRESNYEITKHCMRARFAAHDMEAICREWQLARPDGRLTEPDYNVRMTLFDIFPLPVRFGGNGACQRPVADPDRHRRPGAAKPLGAAVRPSPPPVSAWTPFGHIPYRKATWPFCCPSSAIWLRRAAPGCGR